MVWWPTIGVPALTGSDLAAAAMGKRDSGDHLFGKFEAQQQRQKEDEERKRRLAEMAQQMEQDKREVMCAF